MKEYACHRDGDETERRFRALQSGVATVARKRRALVALLEAAAVHPHNDSDAGRDARLARIEADDLEREIEETTATLGAAIDEHNAVCARSRDGRRIEWRS